MIDINALLKEAESAPMGKEIDDICQELSLFLRVKNARYANSVSEPLNVFSKAGPNDQINSRMDDKLMRIKNSPVERRNDFVDLTGYLVLKCLENDWTDFKTMLD